MNFAIKSLIQEFCNDNEELLRDKNEATGRCFCMSMLFARAACGFGMQPELVRWSATEDEDFSDHWAVLLDSETVIDFTRKQIDDAPGVIHRIDSYPANLYAPRIYPAEMLLAVLDPLELKTDISNKTLNDIDFARRIFDANKAKPIRLAIWQYALITLGILFVFWRVSESI